MLVGVTVLVRVWVAVDQVAVAMNMVVGMLMQVSVLMAMFVFMLGPGPVIMPVVRVLVRESFAIAHRIT